MKKYTRILFSGIIIGLGVLTLTGTGDGGIGSAVDRATSQALNDIANGLSAILSPSPIATTQMGVYSGYTGSLEWTNVDSAGPGVGVGGGDGAGGVGIGGALGQFQNVLVSVKTMKGDLIGRANVGSDGLVTLRTGGDPGPFLIEVEGQAGGQYFDEGKGAYIAFGPGESLRTYVDSVDKNLGVTFATEAVYQYLTAAGFSVPANPPTAKAISDASAVIRDAINAQVDPKYAVSDLKRLPALITSSTSANSLPDNPRGLYGILTAGFAKQAATFNPQVTSPGLESARQFASDLSDGVINGRNGKGVPVAEASRLTYDPSTIKQALTASIALAAIQYGVQQTRLSNYSGSVDISGPASIPPNCAGTMKVVGTAKITGSLALVLDHTEIFALSCFSLSNPFIVTIPLKQDGTKLVGSVSNNYTCVSGCVKGVSVYSVSLQSVIVNGKSAFVGTLLHTNVNDSGSTASSSGTITLQ